MPRVQQLYLIVPGSSIPSDIRISRPTHYHKSFNRQTPPETRSSRICLLQRLEGGGWKTHFYMQHISEVTHNVNTFPDPSSLQSPVTDSPPPTTHTTTCKQQVFTEHSCLVSKWTVFCYDLRYSKFIITRNTGKCLLCICTAGIT